MKEREPEREVLAISPQAQTDSSPFLSIDRANYWYSLHFPCAIACLNTVLRHSEDARTGYSRIVERWDLPEYEPLGEKLVKYMSLHMHALHSRADAFFLLPGLVTEGLPFTDDPAAVRMRSAIGDFIEDYFNPVRRTPKIIRERARFLTYVTLLRSLNDALEINTELWETWPTDQLEKVMSQSNPTAGRGKHAEVQKALRSFGFRLHHNDTLIRWAEIWYLARVQPGSIPDALEIIASGGRPELVIAGSGENWSDDRYLRKHIKDFDIATGRHLT